MSYNFWNFITVVSLVTGVIGTIASCFSIHYYRQSMSDNFKSLAWDGFVALLSFQRDRNSFVFTETFKKWQMIFNTKYHNRFTIRQKTKLEEIWSIMQKAQGSIHCPSASSHQAVLNKIEDYMSKSKNIFI